MEEPVFSAHSSPSANYADVEGMRKHGSQPPRRALPFFPDLHNELCKSWNRPFSARLSNPPVLDYSNIVGAKENGYGMMPHVEEPLASCLAPDAASSLKAPALPSKPCCMTSGSVGRAYMAAGRAGASLHTMAILQAYQADLLRNLDEGKGPTPDDIAELRRATDLSKKEAKKQSAAFRQYIPRRSRSRKAAAGGKPQPSSSSSYRQGQKESVASRAPFQRAWDFRRRSHLLRRRI
ncbi:hypothetical protein PO909_015157 [Leuciscus waleckii]